MRWTFTWPQRSSPSHCLESMVSSYRSTREKDEQLESNSNLEPIPCPILTADPEEVGKVTKGGSEVQEHNREQNYTEKQGE
ncbi:hypothetical protein E2C01_056766 [Portunus trituberculatus]|uniref:Uncharacterized protein n=1 Tax=Portunus trituberculatus TaxID=210409 RepID=A0A5B7H019_PORTR|nr:hypothetical protein [Portunus trituberculatus]